MATLATAEALMARLKVLASPAERDKSGRYGQSGGGGGREGDDFLGVRMGEVFDLAAEFVQWARRSRAGCTPETPPGSGPPPCPAAA